MFFLTSCLAAKTTVACHAILSTQSAQCSDIHKLMTADSNVPFPSSRPWTVQAINLLQGHAASLIPRAMTLPCTCPLYPWPKTRPDPIRPILGSSKESVSRRRQPNHEKMPNVIPVAEAPPLQYASLVHVPIAIVSFPAVTIPSPSPIMPGKENLSAVPSYAESCRRTSLPSSPTPGRVGKGRRVGSHLLHVYILQPLAGTRHDHPRAPQHLPPPPWRPSPSAGRVARANAGRVAVKHTIPVLLNLVHRQLTQRIKSACNPLALSSPPPIPQPVNSLSRIWINSSSSSAAAS